MYSLPAQFAQVFILTLMLPSNPEKCADKEVVPQCYVYNEEDFSDYTESDYEFDMNEVGQREMNKEESRIYSRAVSASEGFDVPFFPDTMAFGRIEPIVGALKEYYAKQIEMAATLSIEDYNKKNGSNYEVVEIIKANYVGVAGDIFYVTYSVKPANQPADFSITIFQGEVFFGIGPDKIKILICRPKPNDGENLEGDQVGMQCCC